MLCEQLVSCVLCVAYSLLVLYLIRHDILNRLCNFLYRGCVAWFYAHLCLFALVYGLLCL